MFISCRPIPKYSYELLPENRNRRRPTQTSSTPPLLFTSSAGHFVLQLTELVRPQVEARFTFGPQGPQEGTFSLGDFWAPKRGIAVPPLAEQSAYAVATSIPGTRLGALQSAIAKKESSLDYRLPFIRRYLLGRPAERIGGSSFGSSMPDLRRRTLWRHADLFPRPL